MEIREVEIVLILRFLVGWDPHYYSTKDGPRAVRVNYLSFNPLTAGAVHIRFLHFLLAYYISAFKPVKDKT